MGISGLETFYNNECEPKKVSISKLLDEYRKENNYVEAATIVVDGTSFLYEMYQYDNLDWVPGGQLKEFKLLVQKVLEKFKEMNVELIFFFDGATIDEKRETWVKRRVEEMENAEKLFRALKSDMMGIQTFRLRLPPGIRNAQLFLQFEFGCKVRSAVVENDTEIAYFAKKNDCFGILSQDSDFMIYEGAKYYFSMGNFNINEMETIIYSRDKLANTLKIHPDLLPLFATLCGNDIVKYEHLKRFHWDIKSMYGDRNKYKQNLHMGIASYIRSLGIQNKLTDDVYRKIAFERFCDNQETTKLLKVSVESYSLDSPPEDNAVVNDLISDVEESEEWKGILFRALERHREGMATHQIWTVLKGSPSELSCYLEDFYSHDLPVGAELSINLRRKIYGILLKEKRLPANQKYHRVRELCVDRYFNVNSQCTFVEAWPPEDCDYPGLLALWNSNPDDEDINNKRWNLFVRAASLEINMNELKKLDHYLVVLTIALKYMVENLENYKELEIKTLIALALRVKKSTVEQLSNIRPKKIHERPVRLASLYMRIQGFLIILISSLNGPISLIEAMPWNNFDGNMFQFMYGLYSNTNCSDISLCNNDDAILDQYKTIVKLVLPKEK